MLHPRIPRDSIVINEMSKRKSSALVAFHSGDRLIREDAAGLVARYPEKVYSQIRDLIGKPVDYAKRKLAEFYLPFDVVEDSRGVATIRVEDGTVYGVEDLMMGETTTTPGLNCCGLGLCFRAPSEVEFGGNGCRNLSFMALLLQSSSTATTEKRD